MFSALPMNSRPLRRWPLPAVTHCLSAALLVAALAACSPALNWREIHGADAPFTVLLPAKPTSFTRSVDLGGIRVEMNMTAAEVDDVSFAVASARVEDANQRRAALSAMQAAMLRNIGSATHAEKTVMLKGGASATEVVASGSPGPTGKPALALHARFAIHGDRVYQAIALGPRDKLTDETADTFLASFVLH